MLKRLELGAFKRARYQFGKWILILFYATPGSRSWVAEQDLCVFESNLRETLAASSYMDALQTAAATMIRTLDNPILLRLIMVSANALLEIVQRAAHSLQLVTMHRRDL